MTALAAIGDLTLGHFEGCFLPPTPILTGSPNVLVNGRAAATIGSRVLPHFCVAPGPRLVAHVNRIIVTGSPTVFINGLAAATIGSLVDCGDTIGAGSPSVNCAV